MFLAALVYTDINTALNCISHHKMIYFSAYYKLFKFSFTKKCLSYAIFLVTLAFSTLCIWFMCICTYRHVWEHWTGVGESSGGGSVYRIIYSYTMASFIAASSAHK